MCISSYIQNYCLFNLLFDYQVTFLFSKIEGKLTDYAFLYSTDLVLFKSEEILSQYAAVFVLLKNKEILLIRVSKTAFLEARFVPFKWY